MKRSGVAVLNTVGLIAAARTLQRSHSVVLTYHGVLSDDGGPHDFLNHNFVSAAAFEQQVAYICEHYRPISLRRLVRCYSQGIAPPPRSVAVTFDDGFANNYSVAYPLLQRRGVPFTVFVTTGLADSAGAQLWTERVKRSIYLSAEPSAVLEIRGRKDQFDLSSLQKRAGAARHIVQLLKRLSTVERNAALAAVESVCGRPELRPEDRERYEFLTWRQIKEMASAGVEFGSHTVTHPILSGLDAKALEVELVDSKRHLERVLGDECYAFAYPNGSSDDYGEREKVALRASGYRCAFSLRGTLNRQRPDLYQLDRININRQHDQPMFRAAATGLLGRARRAREKFAKFRRISAIGRTEVTHN